MKRFWLFYLLTVGLSIFCIALVSWILVPTFLGVSVLAFSPLPKFLSLQKNAQVASLDLWQPAQKNVLGVSLSVPDISAQSTLSYDITTNQILFSKNPDKKLPLASLTKIMTAIVSLEHPKLDDKYLVKTKDLVGEDSMGLHSGELLSLKELLLGLILHSGNDAAETLADNFPGGRKTFITALNDKAASLGLVNTHFTNPSGLEGDGVQYTTAQDLLVITQYALQNFPLFGEVVATPEYTIAQSPTHAAYYLENETNLLTTYPGVRGVKTGYTPEAGFCLVTYLEYHDHKIIAILLGSQNRRDEMKEILDYSLRNLDISPPPHG